MNITLSLYLHGEVYPGKEKAETNLRGDRKKNVRRKLGLCNTYDLKFGFDFLKIKSINA